jgi:hypothetical protein
LWWKWAKMFWRIARLLNAGWPVDRVTRLGEFSPFGWLFTLGSFSKISKVTQILGATFVHSTSCVLIFGKTWVGVHFVQFFHKLIWSPWQWIFEKLAQNVAQSTFRQNWYIHTYLLPLKRQP